MIDAFLAAVEASPIAEAMKTSRLAYPLVNAAHILSLATLFGAILSLDLRLLGAFRSVPVAPLAELLPKIAAGGLATALLTGFALFAVEPFEYAANPALQIKLLLVAIGVIHALWLHTRPSWRDASSIGNVSVSVKASAFVSLCVWTLAIFAGRFIGFIG
ncbi:DUF2214 domain-containing protein [Fulvimarina sp. MAC8]|uniref:DUF2214 domain-containing protein n=1 Tax=Fulvimarina sp. MAC8 TaxID=3162874 RepID=UPI0032ED0AB9